MWRELQEDVAAIADVRLQSLERAMITARPWTLEAFRRAWMDHPLMRHISRSVVWRAGAVGFRIAQDGTFADASDAAFVPVPPVTVAHPAEMTDEERVRWSSVFNDYLLIQPIEQLSRRVAPARAPTDAKATPLVLVLASSTPLADFTTKRLAAKGFTTSRRFQDQTASRRCVRTAQVLEVTLRVDKQTVVRATLNGDLDKVHPVDLAELAHDLELTRP